MTKYTRSILCIVFVIASGTAQAESTQQYGQWVVERDSGGSAAYTTNASGSSVGLWCDKSKTCSFYLLLTTPCPGEGSTMTGLVSAKTGSFSVDLLCKKLKTKGEFVNFLSNFDDVKTALEQNDAIGFAVALQDEQFRVVRFGLMGSTQAIKAVQSLGTQSGFRDEIM